MRAARQPRDRDDLRQPLVADLRMLAKRGARHGDARHRARNDRVAVRSQQADIRDLLIGVLDADRLDQKHQLERGLLHRAQGAYAHLRVKAGVPALAEAERVIDEVHAAAVQPVCGIQIEFADVEADLVCARHARADGADHLAQPLLGIELGGAQHDPAHAVFRVFAHLPDGLLLVILAGLGRKPPLFAERAEVAVHRARRKIHADRAPEIGAVAGQPAGNAARGRAQFPPCLAARLNGKQLYDLAAGQQGVLLRVLFGVSNQFQICHSESLPLIIE